MINRRTTLGLIAATTLSPRTLLAADREPSFLRALLDEGKLPPMAERLPKDPLVVNLAAMGREPGQYGGSVRFLISGQRDIRLMTINGYSRLVGYDETLQFVPDILSSFEVDEERIFTFRLREGHKWSDGQPFTAEDFRYVWEDVYHDEDLTPGGLPRPLLVDGKKPVFEIVDPLTVRFTWHAPNPYFLPEIASAQALGLVLPAHYMKQFHKKHQDPEKLDELIKVNKAKKWTTLHLRMARQYRPENPELPTLDPWRNTTKPPAERFVFERNAFFHRVDETGQQLPYIDQFILDVSSSAIIVAKTSAGESDLQMNGLDFADYTLLKDAERRHPVKVHLWKRTQGARVALLPNMNCADPTWLPFLRDVRLRRALSLAINRREINLALFYGLSRESADTVLPESMLFRPEFPTAWAAYDPDQANALLDEVGLKRPARGQIRLLPDGNPAQLVVETAGESTLDTDVLELVTDHWREVGIKLFIRTSQRDVFRSRAIAGQITMSLWSGIDNGIPTAEMSPNELAPTADEQLQWPVWGLHYLSNGEQGSPPDMPEAAKLLDLLQRWGRAVDSGTRASVWNEMLALWADQVFSIGIVNSALQPILTTARLRNFPPEGLYSFNPTSYLGVYKPDTFWLAEG
ncbi:ABC transporter substrate-binding protein [Arvimicrobium flavum]|uniref:ABC transporter substrate-binding protein n=1 Tax=Arvimicrobium flavum TaxID=3393320 RepID=UPI00237A7C31|nr:ABC transporter substrate-binding protein [Mesorhizobium shangrilense]